MIPKLETLPTGPGWKSQLRTCIKTGSQLLDLLDLAAEDVGFSDSASADFPLRVPLAYARRMTAGDPRDPLLMQVLASADELVKAPGYSRDPVGETGGANPVPGVIHKYRGRALLIVSSGCAIHCRYCFRRHFPYAENQNGRGDWHGALGYIRDDPGISEVILSGGDPLVLGDGMLAELVDLVAAIPHVRRLRVHTRLPVVIPDRVTGPLLDALCRRGLQTVLVIHSNHANEVDADVGNAMATLRERGVTLLNQSVLLAGVNDSAEALTELSERLFEAGVTPYYLHLLDKVQGAAHFDVPEQRARRLLGEIAARVPGYLVPRLVRERAGAASKITLEAIYRE